MLPWRSTTSTWHVSPAGPRHAAERRLAHAEPAPTASAAGTAASRGSRPSGRARAQLERRLLADQRAPLVGVAAAQQRVERHVREGRVAVPRLAVGEGELRALDDGVDVLGRQVAHGVEVEASSSASGCSSTGPWLHGPGLADLRPRCSSDTGGSYDAENARGRRR